MGRKLAFLSLFGLLLFPAGASAQGLMPLVTPQGAFGLLAPAPGVYELAQQADPDLGQAAAAQLPATHDCGGW